MDYCTSFRGRGDGKERNARIRDSTPPNSPDGSVSSHGSVGGRIYPGRRSTVGGPKEIAKTYEDAVVRPRRPEEAFAIGGTKSRETQIDSSSSRHSNLGSSPLQGVVSVDELADACFNGKIAEIRSLLAIGLDVNQPLKYSGFASALTAAASGGDPETVKLLLEAGADINQHLTWGRYGNALVAAVSTRENNTETVKLLLEAGAEINQQLTCGDYGSALTAAILYGNPKIVKLLLEAGADVNQQLHCGCCGSALAAAAVSLWNKIETVKLLLEAGADVNQQLTHGDYGSALAAASFCGNPEIVKLLLEAGADVNQQLTHGYYGSALAAAVRAGEDNTETVELLLKAGADVNQQLTHGDYGTALTAAIFGGDPETIKLLLEAGADINQQIIHGGYGSALAAAVCTEEDNTETVKLLLEAGADINRQLIHGDYGNALVAAAATPWTTAETVKLLLEAGSDVNQLLTYGSYGSALVAAAFNGNAETMDLLIKKGANVSQQLPYGDYENSSAMAVYAKQKEIFMRLRDAAPNLSPLSTLDRVLGTGSPDFRTIYFSWELPTVIDDLENVEAYLSNIGTLTRCRDTVKLATSGDFLREMYGTLGTSSLHGITRSLKSPQSIYGQCGNKNDTACWRLQRSLVDGNMAIKTTSNGVVVHVSESIDDVKRIMQWICLTFRKPIPNYVCYSTSINKGSWFGLDALQPMPTSNGTNECWRSLFSSAVVVTDLSREVRQSRGLELDFYVMLQLAAVEYPVSVDSGLVLMGFSTALVPVQLTEDDKVLWHLEIARNDLQLKTSDLHATRRSWWRVKSLDLLSSKTAILGWCSEANVLLGTNQLTPKVAWSDARVQRTTWHWKGANLQVVAQSAAPLQMGGQLGMSFDRAVNTLRFNPSQNYLKCLKSSTFEQVVLYDVSAERAWLVPLVSVFHHMLLVYTETVHESSRANSVPTINPTPDGALSSLEALKDKGAAVVESSGGDVLTIRELVMGFSVNISKLSPRSPRASVIYGYEFMDIVMDSPKSELRKKRIGGVSSAWMSILNDVNCLLCSGLGDAIVGRRSLSLLSPCNRLPRGSNLMAATMHSIRILSTKHGGSVEDEVHMLTNKHYFFLSGDPFDLCEHEDNRSCCWNNPPFLQVIQTRQPSCGPVRQPFMSSFPNGALVFGGEGGTRAFFKYPFRARETQEPSRLAASVSIHHDHVAH